MHPTSRHSPHISLVRHCDILGTGKSYLSFSCPFLSAQPISLPHLVRDATNFLGRFVRSLHITRGCTRPFPNHRNHYNILELWDVHFRRRDYKAVHYVNHRSSIYNPYCDVLPNRGLYRVLLSPDLPTTMRHRSTSGSGLGVCSVFTMRSFGPSGQVRINVRDVGFCTVCRQHSVCVRCASSTRGLLQ